MEVKTWKLRNWTTHGRAVNADQITRITTKAGAIVWCRLLEHVEKLAVVELMGWNTPADVTDVAGVKWSPGLVGQWQLKLDQIRSIATAGQLALADALPEVEDSECRDGLVHRRCLACALPDPDDVPKVRISAGKAASSTILRRRESCRRTAIGHSVRRLGQCPSPTSFRRCRRARGASQDRWKRRCWNRAHLAALTGALGTPVGKHPCVRGDDNPKPPAALRSSEARDRPGAGASYRRVAARPPARLTQGWTRVSSTSDTPASATARARPRLLAAA